MMIGGKPNPMRRLKMLLTVFAFGLLGGCGGTQVPEIQEFWGDANDTAIKVNAIAGQVKCELSEAVRSLIANDKKLADERHIPRQTKWLETWYAQVALILTIDEKTALSPGLSLTTPFENAITRFPNGNVTTPQSFSLGLGGTLSADATRIDKLNYFYVLSDFLDEGPKNLSCIPIRNDKGDLFLQSDLKLREWLYIAALPKFTGIVEYPAAVVQGQQNVISHEVKFEIISSGNITPTWKLVRVSANTGASPLFGTSRDRTQDLIITLGPAQKAEAERQTLSTPAQNSALASEIGASVAAAIKSSQ